ncbi:MAG: beta-galactosidase, partial [Bacteroidia bacterium]|nr:beta-galactosidase [Bacteroidia bacterium]
MNRIVSFIIGLSAIISVGLTAQTQTILGFQVPALAPVPVSVSGVKNPVISLNGQWDFRIDGQGSKSGKISVPGEWEMQGFSINEGETAVYSRLLSIPADWKGKPVRIRFDAVSSHAQVKVNGKTLGEHEGSFVPFEVDITNALTFNNDTLEVEVQALTISDRLACTSQYACHTVGGILRKVTLFATSPVHITENSTNTVFDAGYRDARLLIRSTISNYSGKNSKPRLVYSLADDSRKQVASGITSTLLSGTGEISGTIDTRLNVKKPHPWNPEHPYLYTLTTIVFIDGKIVEIIEQKVGIREIAIQGNRVLVNGSPIKLHGVNRHSVYPLTGRSTSPELDRKDAELFRAANCNYIRTSHYPPSEEFLNAADELGLFVECEASLCWIQHHASPIWRLWDYLDEKYLPFMVRANLDNVVANRNHPSVIIWSLGNESRWSPLWEKVNEVVKQLDPTRPTSFHDQCWGGFNNAGSKADIANYHYPGLNGPRAADTMNRPTLFGEYAHLTTYNRRELLTDPGVRSAYSAPLVMFYDSIYNHDGNLGAAIWSG